MPPRSVKMKRRIFGFQRRVWWPKWTPASSSSRMETTDTCDPSSRFECAAAGGRRVEPASSEPAPPPGLFRRVGCQGREILAAGLATRPRAACEIGRQRRLDLDLLAA